VLAPDAWGPLAEILRPHGVRGELRLKLFNKDSDVLLHLDEVLIRQKGGEEDEVSVDGARRADEAILMRLHSVSDRDRAAELRGALVCARRESFPPLEDGEFYTCDVVGAVVRVRRGDALEEIGTVREVLAYPSADVFAIRATDGGKDWEVPLLGTFIEKIDPEAGVVTLATLEGIDRG
jgi:16S rRNA processing protein RimM